MDEYPREAVRTAFEHGATHAEELYGALCDLQRAPSCWCEMGTGNPAVRQHSPACVQANKAEQAYRLHRS